ncbi:MAG: ChbG/HpnK family deacetylase [Blastocatellia bacterium]|nr:ChbG/HpnK family deacetylase [Blastocatellia bacterium]
MTSHSVPTTERRLIVNADDFGMCHGVNTGIVAGHTNGIITSATLMANGDAFDEAVALAKAHPTLGVGCHLVLLGGRPVTNPRLVPSLLEPDGTFNNDFGTFTRRLVTGKLKVTEIICEFRAQIEKIQAAGLQLTHLDSHKHSHAHPLVLDAMLQVATEFGIPAIRNPFERFWRAPLKTLETGSKVTLLKQQASRLVMSRYARQFNHHVAGRPVRTPEHFFGFMHTGLLTTSLVTCLLAKLPTGTSELMCHPSHLDDTLATYKTRLKESRVRELQIMMSPEVRETVNRLNIRLVNFQQGLGSRV